MHMLNEEAGSLKHNNKLKILNNKLLLYSNMIVLSFKFLIDNLSHL
jgi:hypothetical protein